MKNNVRYEWCWEFWDQNGEDILDLFHGDTLAILGPPRGPSNATARLTLIRNWGNDIEGLRERTYAYPEDGRLPAEFENGIKVPRQFQKELAAHQ
jgi:hypothetical protein